MPLTGYTGHIQTDATGLMYMKGRFYSPAWHRFPNSDGGVDPLTENEYAYVRNNPFGATDPTGMSERSRDSQKVKAITAAKVGRTTEQLRKETLQEAKGRLAGVATVVAAGAVVTAGPALATAAVPLIQRFKEAIVSGSQKIGNYISNITRSTSNSPIGFAQGTGNSAFTPDRLQHASRHLTDAKILGNWSKATGQEFINQGTKVLESPSATFNHILRSGEAVKGFIGNINGQRVAIMVYSEGANSGKVATAVLPSAKQLTNWGIKP